MIQSLAGRVYKLCHDEDNRTDLDLVKEMATKAHTGKFVDCYLQGDSIGICNTLGNDSMRDSKQKSS